MIPRCNKWSPIVTHAYITQRATVSSKATTTANGRACWSQEDFWSLPWQGELTLTTATISCTRRIWVTWDCIGQQEAAFFFVVIEWITLSLLCTQMHYVKRNAELFNMNGYDICYIEGIYNKLIGPPSYSSSDDFNYSSTIIYGSWAWQCNNIAVNNDNELDQEIAIEFDDELAHIESAFEYLIKKKYPPGCSKNHKRIKSRKKQTHIIMWA